MISRRKRGARGMSRLSIAAVGSMLTLCVAGAAALVAAQPVHPGQPGQSARPVQPIRPSLRELYKGHFLVGAALNERQFKGEDPAADAIVRTHFNTISPENVLKWEIVHPRPGGYDFTLPDAYVAYGEANRMFVIGHTLVWHSQTPRWVFEDSAGKPLTRDALLARMRDHIRTVAGRYKGRIKGWDVVNEALEENGTMRKSPWQRIIGDDFVEEAFITAHEVDPAAELYYNDYSLENPEKRAGAVALIKRLQARGIPVKAIGLQGHYKMDWPSIGLADSTIAMFAALGIKVNVTELDVDVLPAVVRGQTADVSTRAATSAAANPYADSLPAARRTALAKRYGEFFALYLKHRDVMDRITFWGVADADSWLNNWPVRGRTSYPLLFDRQHRPKEAFDSVVAASRKVTLK